MNCLPPTHAYSESSLAIRRRLADRMPARHGPQAICGRADRFGADAGPGVGFTESTGMCRSAAPREHSRITP